MDGLVGEGILTKPDLPLIETIFLIHAGHSYPIPSVDRNAARNHPRLPRAARHLLARPVRFMEYEIGNQDHSLMQGVELSE